jgi:hypothetical protein
MPTYTYVGATPRYLKGYGGPIVQNAVINLTTLQVLDIERGNRTRLDQDTNFVAAASGGGGGSGSVVSAASPPAAPADPTKPAIFYPVGGGTMLTWDVATQAWL